MKALGFVLAPSVEGCHGVCLFNRAGVFKSKYDVGFQDLLYDFDRVETTVAEGFCFWIHVTVFELVVEGYYGVNTRNRGSR